MGNDILSVFIERKRKATIRSSLLFIKYLIDDKGCIFDIIGLEIYEIIALKG